jgi:hypothetical protein
VSAQCTDQTSKQALNAYSLPSIGQTIKYLHAAAGYPTKKTWIKAIQAGNYNIWPALMIANKHFPESNKTQKGHTKCQCQGVRSTKERKTITKDEEEETTPELATHTETP